MSDPFAELNARRDIDHELQVQNDRFESALVEHTLKRFNLQHARRQVSETRMKMVGVPQLTFEGFLEAFPTFPFVLGANRLRGLAVPWQQKPLPLNYEVHKDSWSLEPHRFKSWNRVPFVEAYKQFYDAVMGDGKVAKPVGLIFPRKGFRYGMIIHNDSSEHYWDRGLCWVYKDRNGKHMYVQPYTNLLEAVYAAGRGWKP
jgi:hypothetical protein